MTTAALGGQVDVPTISGEMTRVRVPDGTESGKQFRLKGKGMPHLRGRGRGDAVYEVIVEVPTHLTARQRELLEELRGTSEGETGPRVSKFLERMKHLFGS